MRVIRKRQTRTVATTTTTTNTNTPKRQRLIDLTPATMTEDSAAQRNIDEEIGTLLLFKMKHIHCHYRLRHTSQTDDEAAVLQLMARYKAIADLKRELEEEPTMTDEEILLDLIKQEALEECRVKVEGARSVRFEAIRNGFSQRSEDLRMKNPETST